MKHHLQIILLLLISGHAWSQQNSGDGESYLFDGHYGQIEVGGRYAGAEFHGSRPLPSRISFYYPVANSIDLSTDYWKRGESRPMAIGIRIGNEQRHWLGREPWTYRVSPHKVTFERSEGSMKYLITCEFCLNEPAMVYTLVVKTTSQHLVQADIYTHLRTVLRTCQTFARIDTALTGYDSQMQLMTAKFDNPETDRSTVFVQNAGASPSFWTTSAEDVQASDSGTSNWINSNEHLKKDSSPKSKVRPIAAFEYDAEIGAGDSLKIVQIIGSCKSDEVNDICARLASSWRQEIASYDELVKFKMERQSHFITGDAALDNSVLWAKGILAANAHYLDTKIVPMPCPAEYNFFFTHDLLMTDLGAVNFDLPRVKSDLLYVASLAKDQIIPHAYYWRDDGYKTEYCTPDNWNHFWFILATGSYLRHSLDDSTGERLLPLVTKSLREILTQVKSDHLMYAFRPDWWDIGHIEGARTYTTVLAIRALREYLFISSFLRHRSPKLLEYEHLADSMQKALTEKLWDSEMKYLINDDEGIKDKHYYMGSLLASAYGVVSSDKSRQLVETAGKELMAEGIGVRTAMPPDFHTEESIQFYKFHGDEAGQPYLYINGGVWPHSNSWYALALNATGKKDDALNFVKSTMTVEGIMRSPMGQPAMYEYRYTDPSSKEYGRIDKPSFLWAGGFYLKSLYALFGVSENEWNISLSSAIPASVDSCRYTLTIGAEKNVTVRRSQGDGFSIMTDEGVVPSMVVPLDLSKTGIHNLNVGPSSRPYLQSMNALLDKISYDDDAKKLDCRFTSFEGHNTEIVIEARNASTKIVLDGVEMSTRPLNVQVDGMIEMRLHVPGSNTQQHLEIYF